MTIVIIVEGPTEVAFREALHSFVDARCGAQQRPRPRLQTQCVKGALTNYPKLARKVSETLKGPDVSGVIALTDVYPHFKNAAEARGTLAEQLPDDPRVHAHCALHDFEAWLLPYWEGVCTRLGRRQRPPGARPEHVDLNRPPSKHLVELYRLARRKYDKPRDGAAILRDQDLTIAANACPELKALLNTILDCAGLALLD